MAVTVKQIAELANVSRGTVDRVLNNRSGVSEATRQKVLKIAKELHYEPNFLAKALVSKKESLKIGVILTPDYNPFIHDIHRLVGVSCRREAVGAWKRSAPHSTRTLRGCSTPNGDHCLLGTSSKLDEAGFYHSVGHAGDDQCASRCQTLRSR